MKKTTIHGAVLGVGMALLSGCVSVEFPNVVSDTAKLGKDAYRAVTGSKEGETKPATPAGTSLAHSVVGTDKQTVADLRSLCIDEATAKLRKATGAEAQFEVQENSVSTVGNSVIANCRLAVKPVAPVAASR